MVVGPAQRRLNEREEIADMSQPSSWIPLQSIATAPGAVVLGRRSSGNGLVTTAAIRR